MRTSVTISSSASALVKKSTDEVGRSGSTRSPFGPRAITSAPVASSTEFQSPSGSQCATEPHSVPRLRTSGSEIHGAADATAPNVRSDARDVGVAHQRADPQVAVRPLERVEPGDAVDVDELRRGGEADLHHRDQALAAGEEAGVVTAFTFRRDRLLDGVRRDVVEPGREHVDPPLASLLVRRGNDIPPDRKLSGGGTRPRHRVEVARRDECHRGASCSSAWTLHVIPTGPRCCDDISVPSVRRSSTPPRHSIRRRSALPHPACPGDDFARRQLDLFTHLIEAVGDANVLWHLDTTPLPDEPFDWSAVEPCDAAFGGGPRFSDRCCLELLDAEYRTANPPHPGSRRPP